jgi:hypothetical protein
MCELSNVLFIPFLRSKIEFFFVYFKIPSIASRLDILADIADQMEHNVQKQLFFKYLIESIQKQQQQQDKPVDCSTKITEQPFKTYPFGSDNLLNSNENPVKEFYKRIQQVQEHLINVNQPNSIINSVSINSIPPKKRYKSNSSSSSPPPPSLKSDINPDDHYSERRRKNNEAAKRSRDTRRAKEDEIALR